MDARSTLKNTQRNVWAAALLMAFSLAWIPSQAQAQLGLGRLIVTITSPAPGSPVSGTTPVNASVSIIGSLTVSQVQFYRDGNLIGSDSASPYSVSWNTTSTNNGSHTLTAVATDILGARWNSDPVTVTVSNGPPPDTTPPSVPTGLTASAVSSSQINLSWAASSDIVGVSGYRVYRNGTQIATTSATSFTNNTGLSPSTTYTYAVAAFDAAGNLSAQSSPASATTPAAADTTPPTVSISSPANGQTISTTVTVSANASDNVGVVGVQFQLDGVNGGAEDTTAPYSIPFDPTTTSNGQHTITAVARDAAGNRTTSAPVTVTVANAPPPDTTPPTVSISSPANGATISATVTVSASASDNVGVVGVQFLLDNGVNGSADVTTAPYSVSWNTATASDGSHTITAVARSAAGNSKTSAPVTVTVANNAPPPPPPPPPVTRFEDTDPSVVYSGPGWRSDMYAALSNGGATASDQAGAQATFTFTGTSVSWIGGRWVEEGIARVFLDGSFVAEVDTYSKTKEVQVPLFTAVGLADTSHTLMIEVTGRKNVASNLAFVLVDAFDVPAATISRLQDTDPSVTFTGSGWLPGVTGGEYSGGTVAGSLTAGDQATFTFTGTGVRWLGELGPDNGGIARVFLDGAFMEGADTYAPCAGPRP